MVSGIMTMRTTFVIGLPRLWTFTRSIPERLSHASVAGTTLEVPANLIRLSVGLEDADDLIADLEQAFRQI